MFTRSGSGGVENRDTGSGAMVSEVTIPHAGPEHAGEYRCLARNLYGSGELVFRLFVKGKYCFHHKLNGILIYFLSKSQSQLMKIIIS